MTNEWDDTHLAAAPIAVEQESGQGRAYLVVVRGNNAGEIYPVVEPDMVIGRASGADLRLNDEGLSRFHCKVRHEPNGFVVEDLGSRNGTYCNGGRVMPGIRPLVEGDRLQIGTNTVLRFTFEEAVEPTPLPADEGVRDALTGTYSRRYFVDRLQRELDFALRHGSPLSLLLLQIDRFPELSMSEAKGFADEITRKVAGHVRDSIRDKDNDKDLIVAHFSGGKFALMSRAVTPGDTFMLAQRLRQSTAGLTVSTVKGDQRITLSLAVAAVNELRIETVSELLIAADVALHRARGLGGDRVVHCTQDLLRDPDRTGPRPKV